MDGKKVVALSTLRQISVVGVVLSMGSPRLAFLHLMAHAFVKSYLFVVLGHVLHSRKGGQDYRSLAYTKFRLSRSLHTSLSLMALVALPFLTIFYSKETLLIGLSLRGSIAALCLVLSLGARATVLYSLRIASFLFLEEGSSFTLVLKDFKVRLILLAIGVGSSCIGLDLLNFSSQFQLSV